MGIVKFYKIIYLVVFLYILSAVKVAFAYSSLFENVEISSNCLLAIQIVLNEFKKDASQLVNTKVEPLKKYTGIECQRLDDDSYFITLVPRSLTARPKDNAFQVNITSQEIDYAP